MNAITHSTDDWTDLQRDIAAKLIAAIRAEKAKPGSPIRESRVAQQLSVSRTPVRATLDLLCAMGAVAHLPRRGYVLSVEPSKLPDITPAPEPPKSDATYNRLIDLYFDRALPDQVSEAELIRTLGVDRASLQVVLARLSVEGIIKQKPGYGWQFEPLLRSRAADEESYRFRLILEPAALREPTFVADIDALGTVRKAQEQVLDRLDGDIHQAEVFEANNLFHETLARFSGNRFIINAIRHQARMRRLVEYRHYLDRERVAQACNEHIAMIEAILDGERDRAAALMHDHIVSAAELTAQSKRGQEDK